MTKTESLLLNYMYELIGIEEAISTKALYHRANKALLVPRYYLSRCLSNLTKQGYTEKVAKVGLVRFYRVTAEGARHRNDDCSRRGREADLRRGVCEGCNRDNQLLTFFKKQYLCKKCFNDYDDTLRVEDFVYKQEGWLY